MLPQSFHGEHPFDLNRFISAQADVFDNALAELRRGQKASHWMWFIFPQFDGLGSSPMSKRYAIRSVGEARAYAAHPVLGKRLEQCCEALLAQDGKTATEIMGYPDDLKLRSSMTLFLRASKEPALFGQVLERFFGGKQDRKTLELLQSASN